jgi:Delta7-sterol 5-desaturase
MKQLPDLSDPFWFLLAVAAAFLFVIGRYLLVAGLFFMIFYRWFPEKWHKRKINARAYRKDQFRKEVLRSTVSAGIFALSGALILLMWQKGFTRVYIDVHAYPLWWLPISLVISLLLHETYYYWLHRWMHHPRVFRFIHKAHHDSHITSPWTAFSFHPLEGILQAAIIPVVLMVLPMHLYVVIFQLTIMTFSSVINHLDIELYPENFNRHFLGRWLIGATHHSLHHRQFKYNYGLYFTFWDKWKKTESPIYNNLFEEKTTSIITKKN